MRRSRRHVGVAAGFAGLLGTAAVVAVLVSSAGAVSQKGVPGNLRGPRATSGLGSRLGEIVAASHQHGVAAASRVAREQGIDAGDGRVLVIVEAASRRADAAAAVVSAAGGTVTGRAGDLLEVRIAPGALERLQASSAILRVKPPAMALPQAVTGEGVEAINASAWHALGLTGAGVKVGIIDEGFAGYAALLGDDLPAAVTAKSDLCADFASTDHGTAVAEIVHEVAPGASLHLICFENEVDLASAEEYAEAQGLSVIVHPVGWFETARGDGTGGPGTPDAIAAKARAAGILWVNSAGNQAQDHWGGGFEDADGDRVMTPTTLTVDPVGTACVGLRWDAWPTTTQDFDLYLLSGGTPVAGSVASQSDSPQEPIEEACFTNPHIFQQYFQVAVVDYNAPFFTGVLDLFVFGDGTFFGTSTARSIVEPASSPAVIAVGAACWNGGPLDVADYSSRGPTIDGRSKPDVVGPDSVSTATYGPFSTCGGSGFAGTSASVAQVAGAAALVKQAHPTFSAAQLHAHLLTMGREPGPLAPDPQRGAGNLWLNPPLAGPPFVTTGSEVALANADGSHATDVTVGAGASTAVLSPAGDKIAYASAKDGDYDIYVANADGSGEVNVTANTSNDGDPSWSSDGARLAFVSDRDGNNEIYVMNADGTAQTRLTNWAQEDRDPDFGVGDTKITFVRNPLTDGFVRWDVFTMNADGTGPVNLTDGNPGPSQADPVYSPDGTKIVFDAQSASQGSLIGIYVMNADGSSKTQLTTNATQDHDPAWTADGTRIVFARADATGSGFWDLYAIDPDGTDLLRMTNSRQRSERHPGQAGSASVPPLLAAPPAISGTARIGSYLQATAGSWVGGSPLSSIYQWQRCDGSGSACSPISGATDLFYRLVDADLGSRLRVSLSTSNTSGSKSVTSAASPVVSAAPPQAMALPMIGAGVTLAVGEGVFGTTGVWSGSPALALYWLRCDEFGGFCEAASGSGGQIYFVGPADAGHTLRLAVAATTSGGTTVATSLATGVVPGGGGGGGGSGGGGGGQPADLELTKTANAATAGVGETILYRLQARVKNFQLTSGASQVLVTDTLPAGVELVSTKVNRGPGCTGTTTVTCNLDFLSGQIVGEVEIVARATQSGSLVNTATVAAAQSDPDRSNNTASVTVTVRGPERQPSGPTTAKPISAKKGVTKRGTAKSNLLRGTGLADRLFGLAGDDRLFGLAGSDRLFGGPGNDLLDGGPGSDVLDAGAGNDLLRVRDGSSDTVLCGSGRDTVRADRRDKVARSCETVKRA